MKWKIFGAWLMMLCLLFCGCAKQDEPHLDMANYGEEFRAENENLFPNASCEHSIVAKDASKILLYDEAILYHISTCKYGNCDYEEHYEPHTLVFDVDYGGLGFPKYFENGYLYHTDYKDCVECKMPIQIQIYCEKQDINCGRYITTEYPHGGNDYTECLAGVRDWEEVFKDFPYIIEIRD